MADGSTRGGVGSTLIQLACHSGLRIPITTAATGQCEVRGVTRRCIHRRIYIFEARWDARYYYAAALQSDASCRRAGSILPPRSARAVHPGSTGRGYGHLEVPGP